MKNKVLLAAAIAIAFSTQAQAQTSERSQYISLGPVVGISHNWVSNLPGTNKFNATGYIGLGLVYSKDAHWGWGAQANVSWEGYRIADADGNISTGTPIYLRIPLRAYYFFGDYKDLIRPKVYLGPSIGFKLGETDEMKGGDFTAQNVGTFRTLDIGLNAGVGLNVRLKKAVWLNTDLGYYQGLTDAVDDPAGKYNTQQNLALSLGVLLGIN